MSPARPEDAARLRLLYDLACAFAARTALDERVPLVVTQCREALDAEGVEPLGRSAPRRHTPWRVTTENV